LVSALAARVHYHHHHGIRLLSLNSYLLHTGGSAGEFLPAYSRAMHYFPTFLLCYADAIKTTGNTILEWSSLDRFSKFLFKES
jgi:hypothetical protein